jgi:hypothetical protein
MQKSSTKSLLLSSISSFELEAKGILDDEDCDDVD